MELHVSKYHGLGNDFILLREEEADKVENLTDLIVQVCDRHTGVGADGLIIARKAPQEDEASFEMVYYNQDGSRAPMCGNGIRCFSRFLVDEKLTDENPIPITTLAGLKIASIESLDPFRVKVDMGKADFDPAAISVKADTPVWDLELDTDTGKQKVCSFFMSTVHTVVFDDDAMGEIEQKGKALCFHPFYPEQTNVNFVKVLDENHIQVQTYERGCGVTLACGTGVCASALTCYLKGLCGPKMDVELKRGNLTIEIDEDQRVFMSGPAQKIMEGTYFYSPQP